MTVLLDVEEMSIGYRVAGTTHLAVDSVSFHVERGRSLGLVGESGCGKTTIGMALMGLLPPNAAVVSGKARFEGEDLLRVDAKRLRQLRWRRIAMIFQAAMNALNPVQRVGDQIAEAITTHEPELSRHAVDHRTRALFDLVRIPSGRMKDYPHQFSGGMRQRVIIAMALACNPSLIIADEPTTALDVIVQNQILTAIATFQQEMNIGMIFISHDIAVVADVCAHIGVMKGGRLMEIGTRDEVLKHPVHPYTRMLVGSMVTLGDEAVELHGAAPDSDSRPAQAIPGCPFSIACPHGDAACRNERAMQVDLSDTHRVYCHHVAEDR